MAKLMTSHVATFLYLFLLACKPAIDEVSFDEALGLFPPKSQAATSDLLKSIFILLARPSLNPKTFGTIHSHQIFYFKFCIDMGWDDDLELSKVPLACAQYQLAMFVAHLAEGHTIYCQSIKLAAIKAYVRHVASFIALFQGCDIQKITQWTRTLGKS
jgi:hypothetical protein